MKSEEGSRARRGFLGPTQLTFLVDDYHDGGQARNRRCCSLLRAMHCKARRPMPLRADIDTQITPKRRITLESRSQHETRLLSPQADGLRDVLHRPKQARCWFSSI